MYDPVPDLKDTCLTRKMFNDLEINGTGVAFVGPQQVFPSNLVQDLCDTAEKKRLKGEFSRESPPRIRSLLHGASEVRRVLEAVRFEELMSEWAGMRLSMHPSAHFGCSFNWTKLCPYGMADTWHLDAAPFTAVVLLSKPEHQFREGKLRLFTRDPLELWAAMKAGIEVPENATYIVPFTKSGQVFLFQGRVLPHGVDPVISGTDLQVSGVREGRLTLAVGLYSKSVPELGLKHGTSSCDDRQIWIVEALRARSLALIERIRQRVAWVNDEEKLSFEERSLKLLLDELEAIESKFSPKAINERFHDDEF